MTPWAPDEAKNKPPSCGPWDALSWAWSLFLAEPWWSRFWTQEWGPDSETQIRIDGQTISNLKPLSWAQTRWLRGPWDTAPLQIRGSWEYWPPRLWTKGVWCCDAWSLFVGTHRAYSCWRWYPQTCRLLTETFPEHWSWLRITILFSNLRPACHKQTEHWSRESGARHWPDDPLHPPWSMVSNTQHTLDTSLVILSLN